MNKIICWRSIFTLNSSRSAYGDPSYNYCAYRQAGLKTLIFLALFVAFCPLPASAEDSEAWPEPVYFPQGSEQPAAPAVPPTSGKKTASNSVAGSSTAEKPKGHRHLPKLWPFTGKSAQPEAPFAVVPPKPSAKMADPPASPYPLLRLTLPIVTEQGVIYPGFYLVKPEKPESVRPESNAQHIEPITAANATINANSPLLLTRQNQVLARMLLHEVSVTDENMEKTGTPSPITPANPKLPLPLKIEAKVAADQKSLRLVVTTGKQQFESEAFPVGTDPRRLLTY